MKFYKNVKFNELKDLPLLFDFDSAKIVKKFELPNLF